ncbi:MAG: hypothetical protein M3Q40_01430 [Pseudomonadota bacterium]|nr:hypothetical protein [Pseudomonadota bacterium]
MLDRPPKPQAKAVGAAVLAPGETVEAWLSRADRGLYRSKGADRNRACVEGTDRRLPG